MPRKAGMLGAGSKAMGGGGRKPRAMSTMMGGNPPLPGAMGTGPGAMGPRAAPGSGIGAFKKGGPAKEGSKAEERKESRAFEKKEDRHEKLAKGGHVKK
jgi:hypothetical protein